MTQPIGPTLLEYLPDIEKAVAELANSWHPDDPQFRADMYRQTLCSLSYSYFAYFHADAEHPDWAPLWNPVYTLQPNPDDIYFYAPIRGDLTYRVSGNCGTVKLITFTARKGLVGLIDDLSEQRDAVHLDQRDLDIAADGSLDVIFSARPKPADHKGDWIQFHPEVDIFLVRYRSYDWEKEVDPRISIECLDRVPLKPKLDVDQILARIKLMAGFPARYARIFMKMQNDIKASVGVNHFEPVSYQGSLSRQLYLPAVFQFDEDEALILETDLPKVREYWNFQLNDPYFNAIEYVYRLSHTNGHFAKIASDGRFYAVISLRDPGVPNWLDPAGFTEGTIYGRWYDCDSHPTPTITRVKFADVRKHLPADTPDVSEDERAEELRTRVRAAQRRRRW
ncbi:Protein of unknown function [Sphingomonas sp. YR710]|uniref:DUF1214 domain-containing protein n=1 Tax=Sphingomonas sp. YR710 TaxID=1882773 RepID=UPI000885E604|nr:DUF1214 domain-containing protein [Sphingomonas sp. YR710]SDD69837.1 Protein of unknown function [Sphingomonas sp. YR710]